MFFEFTKSLIDAVEEEIEPGCPMDECDRDSVRDFGYCSKHFFGEQMIDRRFDSE